MIDDDDDDDGLDARDLPTLDQACTRLHMEPEVLMKLHTKHGLPLLTLAGARFVLWSAIEGVGARWGRSRSKCPISARWSPWWRLPGEGETPCVPGADRSLARALFARHTTAHHRRPERSPS